MKLAFGLAVLTAQVALAADKPTIHDVFYTNDDHVHVLSFDLRVADQSLESAWQNSIQQYFVRHDTDSSGDLAGNEITRLPTATECRRIVGLPESQTLPTTADFRPRNGKVTLNELTAWLTLLGAGPFNIRGASPTSANQPALNVDLFAELDNDGDNRLSTKDLSQLASHLKKLDIDDDGSLSINELRPFEPPPQMMRDGNTVPSASKPTLLAATSPTERRTLVNVLLTQFDGKNQKGQAERDSKLASDEIGLDTDTFTSHDLDGDGQLDYEELGQFVRRPLPSVSLIVQVEGSKFSKRLSIVKRSSNAKLTNIQPGRSLLQLDETELEFRTPYDKADADTHEKEFSAADSDSNAYLDRAEIDRTPRLRGLIRLLDSNSDGNVFLEEFARFAADRSSLCESRIVVSADHQGTNLFEIIDSDKNGRISFRELNVASKHFENWDLNEDGFVVQTELPRNFRLTIGLGNLTTLNSDVSRIEGSSDNSPLWFTRMDRNQDGEVALREFVGPLAYFTEYDRNDDGILARLEALLPAK
jgi:Ca2+-binding EF-hand superfamily protein